jgi:propanol-preferring alcohol dehydrogenase
VGTRQDLTEALAFASEGKIAAHINPARLEDANDVFNALKAGRVEGRMGPRHRTGVTVSRGRSS